VKREYPGCSPAANRAKQVVIENLIKQYGTLRALGGVSFGVNPGEWVALMALRLGKTTLITFSAGWIRSPPDMWSLTELTFETQRSQMVALPRGKVGFVFQQFHLVPYLTALET